MGLSVQKFFLAAYVRFQISIRSFAPGPCIKLLAYTRKMSQVPSYLTSFC